MGKSTFLLNEIFDEIDRGDRALVYIDPHGENSLALLDALPRRSIKNTCYIDCSTTTNAVGFNPLVNPIHTLSGLKSIWIDSWGPRMEWLLLNDLLLLSETGCTLKDLPRLHYDIAFRERLLDTTTNKELLKFWRKEYPAKYDKSKDNPDSPILNKIGQLNASFISYILNQTHPKLNLYKLLSEKGLIVLNLSKPTIGDEAAAILGSLFTTTIRGVLLKHPTPTSLYADEFQTYGTSIFAAMLSEMRKFGLKLVLCHQFISQVDESLQRAILGNVQHNIIFNVDHDDAVVLSKSYNRTHQQFNPNAITELAPYEAFVDGVKQKQSPFCPPYGTGKLEDVAATSRLFFGRKL